MSAHKVEDVEAEESLDIASAMGFSGFGAQGKKRKFGGDDNTFIDVGENGPQDKNVTPTSSIASGSNAIAAGTKRSMKAEASSGSTDAPPSQANNSQAPSESSKTTDMPVVDIDKATPQQLRNGVRNKNGDTTKTLRERAEELNKLLRVEDASGQEDSTAVVEDAPSSTQSVALESGEATYLVPPTEAPQTRKADESLAHVHDNGEVLSPGAFQRAAVRAIVAERLRTEQRAQSLPQIDTTDFPQARDAVEKLLGYRFKQESGLEEALYCGPQAALGSSILFEANLRLAQLGDSVLDLILNESGYDAGKRKGDIDHRRAAIASNDNLTAMGYKKGIPKLLLSPRGHNPPKFAVAACVEAILGAVYKGSQGDLGAVKRSMAMFGLL
ncbi:uncharacterized protein LTR77_006378 [Saxophila tyrrhenica]|uniref:RNase III domain-containing protein n=1 Tax=Saxophila tyrrhenica TaxID=1690608 RepID=A0AAV9PAR3_9PEZI|nr:hypothetical protein LTR77_006378 [Saxophila tyrrhenica]